MSTGTKIVIAVVAIGLVVYLFWENIVSWFGSDPVDAGKTIDQAFNLKNPPPPQTDNFPIIDGSRGPRVKQLQQALNTINGTFPFVVHEYPPLVADGVYGPKTHALILLLLGTQYVSAPGMDELHFNMVIDRARNLKNA